MLLEHGVVLPFALKSGLYIGTALYNWEGWNNEIDLPLYSLTPQAIFTNQIPLFDVNFFNPDERRTKFDWVKKVDYVEIGQEALAQNVTANGKYKETAVDSQLRDKIINDGKTPSNASDYWKVAAGNGNAVMPAGATTKVYTDNGTTYIYKSWTDQTGIHEVILVENDSNDNNEGSIKDGVHSLSYDLSGIVSKWYYTLRTFAIVGMMTVLVYIGIRMAISTVASEQAKYKKMLIGWFESIVIIFAMPYIMAALFTIEEVLIGVFYELRNSLMGGNTNEVFENVVRNIIESYVTDNYIDYKKIQMEIRNVLGRFFYNETESKPMIIIEIHEI